MDTTACAGHPATGPSQNLKGAVRLALRMDYKIQNDFVDIDFQDRTARSWTILPRFLISQMKRLMLQIRLGRTERNRKRNKRS
jgi:hypothetical protein